MQKWTTKYSREDRVNKWDMVVENGITEDPNTQERPAHKEEDDSEKKHLCLLEHSFSYTRYFLKQDNP